MLKGRLHRILALPLAVGTAVAMAWAAPAGDGAISGQVVSKTGPPRPVAGVEVALTRLAGGVEEAKATTVTDRGGRFIFRGLVRSPTHAYTLTVAYKGGEYTTAQLAFAPDEVKKEVPVTVYEPTTSEAPLRVTVHHMIVVPGRGALRITEVLGVANPTDRTFIGSRPAPGGRRETLRFPLPAGASEVQYGDGLMECCVVAGQDGFIDTMDVKPGLRQIAFSYTVPVQGSAARVRRPVVYPTDTVELLVADVGVEVAGAGLVTREPVETPEARYLRLSGAAFRAGASVAFDLTGLASGSPPTRWIAAGTAMAAMALGITVALRRAPRAAPAPMISTGRLEMRRELVEDLADLDERFAAGGISEAEYLAERSRKKRALADILRAAGGSPGAPR